MNFETALGHIKTGRKVFRSGWNGTGMFVYLVPASTFKVDRRPLLGIHPRGFEVNYNAHIDMRCADGTYVPWLASQGDLLSDDWAIIQGSGV